MSVEACGEESPCLLTVECRVHSPHIHQQADHGHAYSGSPIVEQLVFEDLACLAALGHGVNVDFGKGMSSRAVRRQREDPVVILEDHSEKFVLDVPPP